MPRKGEIDELWEALIESLGWNRNEITTSQRGPMNRALKELREVGATPAEIKRRAAVYADRFAGLTLTPAALAKWWPELGRQQMQRDMSPDERRIQAPGAQVRLSGDDYERRMRQWHGDEYWEEIQERMRKAEGAN